MCVSGKWENSLKSQPSHGADWLQKGMLQVESSTQHRVRALKHVPADESTCSTYGGFPQKHYSLMSFQALSLTFVSLEKKVLTFSQTTEVFTP